MNKSRQLERIGDHIQQSLLLAYGIRNIDAHQTNPSNPQIHFGNRHILGADIPLLIHHGKRKRIGPFFLQSALDFTRLQSAGIPFPILRHQGRLQHAGHVLGMLALRSGHTVRFFIAG